jgi:oxygen-independent coproporphyrinogen-3 oxidase
MCYMAADLGPERSEFGDCLDRLAPLMQDGICEIRGDRIEVRDPARPMVRLVAAAFDAYLGGGPGRHARAV